MKVSKQLLLFFGMTFFLANNFCVKSNFAVGSEKPLGVFHLLYTANKIILVPIVKCIKYFMVRLKARYKNIHPLVLKFNSKFNNHDAILNYLKKHSLKKCFNSGGEKFSEGVLMDFGIGTLCGIAGLLFFKYLKKIDIKALANENNIDWNCCIKIQQFFLKIKDEKQNLLKDDDIDQISKTKNLAIAIKYICTKMKNNYYTLINQNGHIIYLIAYDGIIALLDTQGQNNIIIQAKQTKQENELDASFVKTVEDSYSKFLNDESYLNEFFPVLPF